MYRWFLGISVKYVGLTSPPTTCEQRLVTSLMHEPSKCFWFKVPQCIAALKDFKLPFKKGERTEFHIKLTTNRERSIRKTRYSRRPILGFLATRRVDRGYGTARADTNLFFPYLPACFPCFSLCFRSSSQSSAKIQTELPASQPLTKFLGIQTTS